MNWIEKPCSAFVLSVVVCGLLVFSPADAAILNLDEPDNWGAPTHPVKQWKGTPLHDLTASCDWGMEKFSSKMKGAVVNFYASTADWKKFDGTDLVPENHEGLSDRFSGLRTDKGSEMMGGRCELANDDGTFWTIERIGPFKSTGGYDWWQFGWVDTFMTTEKLRKYPDGFFLLNHFTGGVDTKGHTLAFPPIHIHHVHASPGVNVPFRSSWKKCMMGTEQCSNAWRVYYEQHGDYECRVEDGGPACLLEDLPDTYGKLITGPFAINGELNDVRAPDSPVLEWYYQTAIRWVPKKDTLRLGMNVQPLSFNYFYSPGRMEPMDQSTMVLTYLCPTNKDSLMWYTGELFVSGSLIRGKMHTHNVVFKEGFFFAGTPEQVGLIGARFQPKKAFDPINLDEIGFSSFEQAKHYLLDAFEKNRALDIANGRKPAKLICHGVTDYEEVEFPTGSYKFDRRAPTYCTNWDFEAGDHFVTIGFNQKVTTPVGPHAPGVIPDLYPGHLHWFLMYDSHDEKSHYEYGFYSQDPATSFTSSRYPNLLFGGYLNALVIVLNKGIPHAAQWNNVVAGLVFVGLVVMTMLSFLGYGAYKVLKDKLA